MCGRATNTLLQGDTAVEYPVYSGRGPQYLPYTTSFGQHFLKSWPLSPAYCGGRQLQDLGRSGWASSTAGLHYRAR